MSAEGEIRSDLAAGTFNPYNWYSDITGEVMVDPDMALDAVLEYLKGRELLFTGGTILEVESARPQSGVFTDPEWRVRLAQG
jgi:hypothetical protein